MPAITSQGIGSGLDVETIVSKLVAVERQPVNDLKKRADTLQTKLSAFGKLQSNLSTLRDAAAKLNNLDTWGANLSSSSDTSAVSASTSQSSVAGTYTARVTQLANAQSLTSGVFANASSTVGKGSLTIELGSWNSSTSQLDPKSGSSAITINIGDGEDNLNSIRDKINAASAGVVASVVTDASGARLVMRSASTGESNAFRVSVSDNDGNNADASGLSALAYDLYGGSSQMNRAQAASNARGSINGIDVVSETNTVKDVIDGLSVTFGKVTTNDVSITIGQDKEGIKKAINDFVSAYNALATTIRDQTKFTPKTGTAAAQSGPLQGDSTTIGLQGQMRGMVADGSSLGGSLSRLSDIGLDPQTDGTLKVNTAKLEKAMGNLDSLKKLFSGVDPLNDSNSGVTQRMRAWADKALGFEGALSTKQTALRDSINRNTDEQGKLIDHVDMVEKRLRARYAALDTAMSKLTQLQGYVNQQFR